MAALTELLPVAVLSCVALLAWRRSRRQACWAVLAASAWLAAEDLGPGVFVHRPLLLHVALAASVTGRSDRWSRALLTLSWLVAIMLPFVDRQGLVALLAGAMLVQAWRLRRSATASAQAVTLLAASLVLPVLARSGSAATEPGPERAVVYALLVTTACLALVVGLLRSVDGETEAVIELTDSDPGGTIADLRERLAATRDPRVRSALTRAIDLLSTNEELQRELNRRVEEVRTSRARLVEATLEQQRDLQALLADGALRHLADLRQVLVGLQPQVGDDVSDLVRRCLDELTSIGAELRELATGLNPRTLDRQGLRAALLELADSLPVPVEVSATDDRLPGSTELALWFACAEAVTNAVKHAEATGLAIDIGTGDGSVIAEIRDDGRGGAQIVPGGGLSGLEDRLAAVGGHLAVRSAPGEGTCVTIVVPA